MAVFINGDGTITSIDGEGMTWITGTPYSPKTQAERNKQSDRDMYARWEAERVKSEAERVEREAKRAEKAAKKAKKETEKAKKEAEKAKRVTDQANQPVNACCVLL